MLIRNILLRFTHTQIYNRISCIFDLFHRIFCFLLQNAINSYFNLYYDYWDLITKIWPGSTKWNPPFRMNLLKVIIRIPPIAFRVEIRTNLSRSCNRGDLCYLKDCNKGCIVYVVLFKAHWIVYFCSLWLKINIGTLFS